MTNEHLNRLFESARNVPVETSPDDIATWVGVAGAASTGVLGVAGKLKLFIAKKTLVIMGTTLSIVSVGIIAAISMGSGTPDAPNKKEPTKQILSVQLDEPLVDETVQPADTNRRVAALEPVPPAPPTPPAAPEAPESGKVSTPPAPPAPPTAPRIAATVVAAVESSDCAARCTSSKKRKGKKVKSSGNVVKKEYEIGSFSKLNISGMFDVILIQGDAPKLVFEADDNLQEYFKAEVKSDELFIDMGDVNFDDDKANVVYVTFMDIDKLKFSGVGDVETDGSIKLQALECKISGVGDLNLKMDCDDLEVNFTGVGDVTLAGNGNKADYKWSGVGDLKAKNLNTKDVSLKLSGVGDANVNASEKLVVKLTGLGDVKYSGSPKSKLLDVTGMGEIKGS